MVIAIVALAEAFVVKPLIGEPAVRAWLEAKRSLYILRAANDAVPDLGDSLRQKKILHRQVKQNVFKQLIGAKDFVMWSHSVACRYVELEAVRHIFNKHLLSQV